jgi:hypothetical protein
MSYDFILLHRQPGQSWDEVLEATERRVEQEMDPPFSPSARAWAERIADRLQAHDPQLERFTSRHCIDLDRPDDTGVQVSLFEHELAVTVPYWHTGRAARAVMELVWSYLAILEQETGWETYDPQLGAASTGPAICRSSAAAMPTCRPGFPGWLAATAPMRPSGSASRGLERGWTGRRCG